ncbi:MAG TPA: hypothetical protein ENO22_04835 [candidate division Zixibacteria bacterium]|nr:hypothetical protein [candidate division Zixibacteria bacterium]HEQ98650.1 hypothetical protein [candidate division Zixibacteria bacterium]
MQTTRLVLLIAVLMLFIHVIALSEVPNMFNYQGRLLDDAGNPLNGTVRLDFGIYADTGGTTQLWVETHTSVPVTDGLFKVQLGSATTLPNSVFDGSLRYLGIRVNSGTMLRPLTPIVASPYSFRALHADTAAYAMSAPGGVDGWSQSGNYVYLADIGDSVGIGTISPGSPLEVQGARTAIVGQSTGSGIMAGAITGLNTGSGHGVMGISSDGPGVYGLSTNGPGVHGFSSSGFGGYFDAPKHYFTANVGIGTTEPEYPLDVHSSAVSVRGYTTGGPGTSGIYGRAENNAYGVMGTSSSGRGVYGASTTGFGGYFMGPKHYLNGLTGFATEEPTHRVTVNGAIGIQQSGTTKYHLNYYNNGFNISETNVADYRLYIKEGGNVGIGTSNPTQKLYVNGNAHVAGTFHADAFEANAIGKENIIDEVGLAHASNSGSSSLTTSYAAYLTKQITVPTAGYILAIGCAHFMFDHGVSGSSGGYLAFSDLPDNINGGINQLFMLGHSVSAGYYRVSIPCQRLFYVSGAGTYSFYVIAKREADNSASIAAPQMALLFIPTAYGSKDGVLSIDPEDDIYTFSGRQELEEKLTGASQLEEPVAGSSAEGDNGALIKQVKSLTAEIEVLKSRMEAYEGH